MFLGNPHPPLLMIGDIMGKIDKKILLGLKVQDEVNMIELTRYFEMNQTKVLRLAISQLRKSIEAVGGLDTSNIPVKTLIRRTRTQLKLDYFNEIMDDMFLTREHAPKISFDDYADGGCDYTPPIGKHIYNPQK